MTVLMRSNFSLGALSGLAGVTPGRPASFVRRESWLESADGCKALTATQGAIGCQCQLAAMSEGDAPGIPNRGERQVAVAGTSAASVSASTFQQEESG
jgi:hypothetical protein